MKENGVDADDVELSIENVGLLNDDKVEEINEEISEENINMFEFRRRQTDVRKVWKTKYLKNEIYFVDSNSGECIKYNPITDGIKKE